MTKEQENALKHLKRMVEYLIYPDDVNAIKVAIQAIKDLDKMNGIALDLAYENDELIEMLGAIRAEIQSEVDKFTGRRDMDDYECGLYYGHSCDVDIIDKYRGESKDADSD